MSVIVALFLTDRLKLPDSNASSTKRQVTPFLYIGSHPYSPTLMQGFGMRTSAKIRINFEFPKELRKKVGCPSLISLLKENKQGRRMLPRLYIPLSNKSFPSHRQKSLLGFNIIVFLQ